MLKVRRTRQKGQDPIYTRREGPIYFNSISYSRLKIKWHYDEYVQLTRIERI